MKPRNWPKSFQYSPTSIVRGIHPTLFSHFRTSVHPEDFEKRSDLVAKQKVYPHLTIKKLFPPHPIAKETSEVQWGLFATKKIARGTVLGEYVGEIGIDRNEVLTTEKRGAYTWVFPLNGMRIYICSTRIANELTFSNDFRGIQEKPNIEHHIFVHLGIYYFGYITIREIQPNEELLIDYGLAWEEALKKKYDNQSPSPA